MLGWCIVTLASVRLKASVWFPPLRGMYQRGTCKGSDSNKSFFFKMALQPSNPANQGSPANRAVSLRELGRSLVIYFLKFLNFKFYFKFLDFLLKFLKFLLNFFFLPCIFSFKF